MATNFSLFRLRTLPFFAFYSPPRLATRRLFSSVTTAALSFSILPYGPSLQKGYSPVPLEIPEHSSAEDTTSLDEAAFTRVFDIAALRVSAHVCFTLENRLRGHLLNWPRIKNIARVPGDEIDDELQLILPQSTDGDGSDDDNLVALNRRVYGKAEGDGEPLDAVLYRDKLSRTFNTRGYVRFRNLAKISRPKRNRNRSDKEKGRRKWTERNDEEKGRRKWTDRNDVSVVEVVEDEVSDDEALSRLLGREYVSRQPKWTGSTRLLLLDQQYVNTRIEELPEAIKVLFQEHGGQGTSSPVELVKCKLTLFYGYWQQNEILEVLLPQGIIIPSAFETVGHIAHLNLKEEHLPYKNLIAKVVLDKNKPKIRTVVNKIVAIHNDFRTMQLEVLAGNHSLVTTVVENGLRFHVDLATVYWNSRLATERRRLLDCFGSSDVVCDVFAGVGPIAITAAKKVKHVYANDLNPCAVKYMERNCVLNKLERKIEVFNMDGRRFIQTVFGLQSITQVVMNLPMHAAEFLDSFRGIFQGNSQGKKCTLPRIHVYGFSKAQDPESDFHERIRVALSEADVDAEMHRVRLVAPGKWMLCASFILPESFAYSKRSLNM